MRPTPIFRPGMLKQSGTRGKGTRWLFRKEGRDVGPFDRTELKEYMVRGEVDVDTPVRALTSKEWTRLGDIEEFVGILHEIEVDRRARARDAAMDRAEDRMRSSHRAPLTLGLVSLVIVLGVGGWFGWQWWAGQNAARPSSYSDMLFASLEITELPLVGAVRAASDLDMDDEAMSESVRWKDEAKAAEGKAHHKRRRSGARNGSRPRGAPGTSDDLAPDERPAVTDFSFEGGGGPTVGRSLDINDVNRVTSRATQRFVACAQEEAGRNPDFPGTTVSFVIQTNGQMGGLRLGANGSRAAAFAGCIKRAVRSISVSPFDGQGRRVRIPLRVSR